MSRDSWIVNRWVLLADGEDGIGTVVASAAVS